MCLPKQRVCFLNNLYESWESLVSLHLPSDCCVVFRTNESEIQDTITFCTNLPKKERSSIQGNVSDNDQKRKESPYLEMSRDNDQKHAYMSNKMQLQNHSLTFIQKHQKVLSATSILSRSTMAYDTTASLDKLTCTDYLDFGKCQDRFGRFSWSKNDSNYLDVKLKFFKKGDNREFRLVQSLTMGEADFNQFKRLRNQPVNAAENVAREEKLTPVQISTMSKDMDEQLKVAHKVADVVDRANRMICITLLQYNVDKSESSYAQVRLFAKKKEDEKEVSTSCLCELKT